MSKDDFDIIAYKLLSYLYTCLKAGVPVSLEKAKELCGVNEVYFNAVLSDLESKNLIIFDVMRSIDGDVALINEFRITFDGAEFLSENSAMMRAASMIGGPFGEVVKAAISVASIV